MKKILSIPIFKAAGFNLFTLSLTIPAVLFFMCMSVYAQTWQQVPLRTQAQVDIGQAGGEGFQMPFDMKYAPSDANIMYKVIDLSGVWKSIDGGTSWNPKWNGFLSIGGMSIGIHPTNPNFVLVAGSNHDLDSVPEPGSIAGIIKTTNGGDSWTMGTTTAYIRSPKSGGVKGASYFQWNPTTPTTIYAATHDKGVLKSTDSGDTWTVMVSFATTGKISDMCIHPTANPATLYVICANEKVLECIDGGANTVRGDGLPAVSTILEIEIDPVVGQTMYVSCGVNGVYKSTAGSATSFTTVNTGMSAATNAGHKAGCIAMSPAGTSTLFVSYGTSTVGLSTYYWYKTTDAGANWNASTSWDTDTDGNVDNIVYSFSPYFSGLEGSTYGCPIAAHPTNAAIVSVINVLGQTIKSTDTGANFHYSNSGYVGAAVHPTFQHGITRAENISVFGILDYGNYKSLDSESIFEKMSGPTSYPQSAALKPGELVSPRVIASFQSSQQASAGTVYISDALGNPWTSKAGQGLVRTNGYSKIFWDRHNTDNVYIDVWKSRDSGDTWSQINGGADWVDAMYWGDSQIVYRLGGTTTPNSAEIKKATNAGSTTISFSTVYPPIPNSGSFNNVGRFAVAIDDPDRLYVPVKGKGVYVVTTSAATLYGSSSGLSLDQFGSQSVTMCVTDPTDANNVYAISNNYLIGRGLGIFKSTDKGVSWTNINYNLSGLTPQQVSVDSETGDVYVHGFCGNWKLVEGGDPGTATTGPPLVVTGTSTLVVNTTARLQGDVNPNGLATTISWMYGTQSGGSYPNVTGSQSVSAGTSSIAFVQDVVSLLGSTTYYVKIQANNGSGTTVGSQTVFTTSAIQSLAVVQTGTNTVTTDGDLSEWGTLTNSVSNITSGTPTVTATWDSLWTAAGLHIAISVVGTPTADTGSTTPYNDASSEIYLSLDNSRGGYNTYTRHLINAFNSSFVYSENGFGGTNTGVVAARAITASGYNQEWLIPASNWGGTFTSGQTIGFDIQVNDDPDNGDRNGVKTWNNTVDTDYLTTANYGKWVLTGTVTEGGGSDPAMPTDVGSSTLSLFPDMVFYARLDEGTGSTSIVDATGNNPDGTLTGSVEWTTGTSGSGLKFTGTTTQFVDFGIATNARFGGVNQTYALSVDIKSGTTTTEGAAISRWNTNSNRRSWVLGQNTGSLNRANSRRSWDGSAAQSTANPACSTNLGLTTWRNLIYDYPDTTTVIYLDGVSDGTLAQAQGVSNGTASMMLGKTESNDYPFLGIMDNPRIFNRNLSASEIADLQIWPTVTNGSVTSIYGLWASVTATVTANGTDTNVYVQYGTSSGNWGTKTSTLERYIGTSSTPVTFTRTLGTLTTETTYYYRTVAYNPMGNMVYGVEQSFTTTAGTPIDATVPAGTVTINSDGTYTTSLSVTLNLSATDDIGVEGYYISEISTPPYGTQSGWIAVGTSAVYSNNIPYTFSSGDGLKTIYTWYKDGVGNIGTVTSDAITTDTQIPEIVILSPVQNCIYPYNQRAHGTSGGSITLSGTSSDTNGIGTVTISNSGTTTTYVATGTDTWSKNVPILTVVPDGLGFRAALDELTGTFRRDSSVYASHGTASGSIGTTNAHFGNAGYFDGINNYSNFGDPADEHLDPGTSSFSFGCWLYKTNSDSNDTAILSKKFTVDGTDLGYVIVANASQWDARIAQGTGTFNYALFTNTPNNYLNSWNLLYATIDRDNQLLKTYLNGVQAGTVSIAIGSGSVSNARNAIIGAADAIGNYTKSYIDEVRIYNRVLSQAEITQLYEMATPDMANTFMVTVQDVPGNESSDIIVVGAFPSVQTDWATSVTYKSALLNGSCSANYNMSTVWFDYGVESGVYTGSSTTVTVTGSTDTPVNITLANLNHSTTYYFRAASSNNVGTTYGNEFSFATLSGVLTGGIYNRMDMSYPGSTRFNIYLKSLGIYPGLFWARNAGTKDGIDLRNDPDTVLSDYLLP